jgi:inosose dehydratase
MLDRRRLLIAAGSLALAGSLRADATRVPLGFSLYGMRSLSLDDACRTCREIGYDSIELPVMADWPADSLKVLADDFARLASQIEKHKLSVAGLMENLVLAADDKTHEQNLLRLQSAARVARIVRTNVVETVLGGSPAQWDDIKEKMATRLVTWGDVAKKAGIMVAIKAHVSGAAHLPEHIVWLLEKVGSESLAAAYDPSHFALRGLSIAESWRPLAKWVKFVHVKDSQGTPQKPEFLLPGAGKLDLAALFEELRMSKYTGDVVVEVSGQIHSRAGYEPVTAAKESFAALNQARS